MTGWWRKSGDCPEIAAPTRAARLKWVVVAGLPEAGQNTRVYDEYLGAVTSGESADIEYLAVSLVGPKNRIDEIVGRLSLMA
ncbi:DUF2000 family protein [Agreia sp.]|uniref:DUF2000 family protein n=1 Tax=Agreia sp. TaxID=1872416 RepID=UPI0035BBF169